MPAGRATLSNLECAVLCLYAEKVSRTKNLLVPSSEWNVPGVSSYSWTGISDPGALDLLPWGFQMHSYHEGFTGLAACVFPRVVLGGPVREVVIVYQGNAVIAGMDAASVNTEIKARNIQARDIERVTWQAIFPGARPLLTGWREGGQIAAILGSDIGRRTVLFNPTPIPASYKPKVTMSDRIILKIEGSHNRCIIVHESGIPLGGAVDSSRFKKLLVPAAERRNDLLETVAISLWRRLKLDKDVPKYRLFFAEKLFENGALSNKSVTAQGPLGNSAEQRRSPLPRTLDALARTPRKIAKATSEGVRRALGR
jgi:hypothetical protein